MIYLYREKIYIETFIRVVESFRFLDMKTKITIGD